MDVMDVESAEASEKEMSSFVRIEEEEVITPEAQLEALPWTMAEELVAGHQIMTDSPPTASSQALRLLLAALILGSLASPIAHLVKPAPKGCAGDNKAIRFEV